MLHLDGYLCEIKDVQIRDGLHVLGGGPAGEARVNLVLAVLRAHQVWGGVSGALRGLRAALGETFGVDEAALLASPGEPVDLAALAEVADGPAVTGADGVDLLEAVARKLVIAMETLSWEPAKVPAVVAEVTGRESPAVEASLRFAATEVVPRLARTADELANVLRALDGRFVAAGPSGSPTRGLVNVLPTGRNFYSVDPKAIPSRNAWDIRRRAGRLAAAPAPERHRRVAELGRPHRLGYLGDAYPGRRHRRGAAPARLPPGLGRRVPPGHRLRGRAAGRARPPPDRCHGTDLGLLPGRVPARRRAARRRRRTVAALDEPPEQNYVRAHVDADVAQGNDVRRATARIFGSKPGAYGAGLLPLIDARNWRTDADLAEVYAVWGGYAYGRGLDGVERPAGHGDAPTAGSRSRPRTSDTREHDIVDSDDYFQYHGGMVAMVRHLTRRDPDGVRRRLAPSPTR